MKTPRGPQSWGLVPRVDQDEASLSWRHEIPEVLSRLAESGTSVLCHGMGRSYGDVCLNDGGTVLKTGGLDRLIAFDAAEGIVTCEAGVTINQLLEFSVPRGWFVPVTPGTKYVTLGGAVANDVHGKNHHRSGTFGAAVRSLEIIRSNGDHLACSPTENSELFAATIGGLGLTGVITVVSVKLIPISSPYISLESVKFGSLDEFFDLSSAADARFTYTVSWIDCVSGGTGFGRGIFMGGEHAARERPSLPSSVSTGPIASVPFHAPSWALNPLSIRAFNTCYYHKQQAKTVRKEVHYDSYFYPLDILGNWNRMYGRSGLTQFQCVVADRKQLRVILETIVKNGTASFLAVLKEFGAHESPGIMSFPRRGYTLCLDFPYRGEPTLALLSRLEAMVVDAGGALYPAKDIQMSPASFRSFFPGLDRFKAQVDPLFSSSLWRRIHEEAPDPRR